MKELCKKLTMQDHEAPLYGRVIKDTPDYFVFETGARKQYTVSKKAFFVLQPTKYEFEYKDGVEE